MTEIANQEQDVAWNGPEGAHWLDRERRGSGSPEVTEALLDAAGIRPGDRVVDIGCGAGGTTLLAALRARPGHAVGVDLSELMVRHARRAGRAAGIDNVAFVRADAQTYAFDRGGFDIAVSQFGIMFFSDPVAAFANIRTGLRPGGRLVFVCPRGMTETEWYAVPMGALRRSVGADGLPPSGMFSLADPEHATGLLRRAGFTDVDMRAQDAPMTFGPDADSAADDYLGSGPVVAFLGESGLDARAVRQTLVEALRPYEGRDGVRVPGAHWLVVARA